MSIWQTMEMVHSRSYTHIIKNVYPDPSVVFDEIITDDRILERAATVTEAYDDFLQAAHLYDTGNMWKGDFKDSPTAQWELKELKRKLYRAVANVYILEGIRFYVSFACSFAFGENKLMEGNAKIISLIARDESQHMTITQNILNKWKAGDDPEMVEIVKEEEQNVYKMFEKCVEEEVIWADYLFKDGSMIGLNAKLLQKYVEWTANKRMKSIGMKPTFDAPLNNNPLPWTQHWLSSRGLQVAPKRRKSSRMLLGALNKMLKKILSRIFNYDKRTPRLEEESITGSESARQSLADPETGTDESSRSVHSGSNQTEVHPFPDPWDGDWNDAVINWAYWNENTKRQGKGQEPPEVGETETD